VGRGEGRGERWGKEVGSGEERGRGFQHKGGGQSTCRHVSCTDNEAVM